MDVKNLSGAAKKMNGCIRQDHHNRSELMNAKVMHRLLLNLFGDCLSCPVIFDVFKQGRCDWMPRERAILFITYASNMLIQVVEYKKEPLRSGIDKQDRHMGNDM